MSQLKVERNPQRVAVMLALGGTRENPTVIIPLWKMENSQLNDLVDSVLGKRGLASQKSRIENEIEVGYEYRKKIAEVRSELRRRISEQAKYPKLKWGGLKQPDRYEI